MSVSSNLAVESVSTFVPSDHLWSDFTSLHYMQINTYNTTTHGQQRKISILAKCSTVFTSLSLTSSTFLAVLKQWMNDCLWERRESQSQSTFMLQAPFQTNSLTLRAGSVSKISHVTLVDIKQLSPPAIAARIWKKHHLCMPSPGLPLETLYILFTFMMLV